MQREVKQVGSGDVGPGKVRTPRPLRAADEALARPGSTAHGSIAVSAVTPDGDLRLISLVDAARFLCVSRGTLYDLLRTGQLASVHIGRLHRIPHGELRRFVEARLESERRRDGSGLR